MHRIAVFIAGFLTVSLILALPAAAMESTSYKLRPAVLSGGGGPCASDSYTLDGTAGQSSPVGRSASRGYREMGGYWYQLLRLVGDGDVNGDGVVDLEDAVIALLIFSNLAAGEVYAAADVDGDETIGLPEAVYILQHAAGMRPQQQ